jgi:hypothetical protein
LTDLNNFANILQGEILELEEIEKIVKQLAKERGLNLWVHEFESKIHFNLILPKDVISGWKVTPQGTISYPYFLVEVAKRIAERFEWAVRVNFASAEDDPFRIDAWCEANKQLPKPVTKGRLNAVIEEAGEILEKVQEAIKKQAEKAKIAEQKEEEEVERLVAEVFRF